jgi:hypothetical protein
MFLGARIHPTIMTVKEKQQYTSTHLIGALETFRAAADQHSSYQLYLVAKGLLNLTMALQNVADRLVVIETHLDLSDDDA